MALPVVGFSGAECDDVRAAVYRAADQPDAGRWQYDSLLAAGADRLLAHFAHRVLAGGVHGIGC